MRPPCASYSARFQGQASGVDATVGAEKGLKPLFARLAATVFHADDPGEALLAQPLGQCNVVELPGAGLLAARGGTVLDVTDLVPALLRVLNQLLAVTDLSLVVEVRQELA